MNRSRVAHLGSRAAALALAAMFYCANAAAQVLTDPTRPPAVESGGTGGGADEGAMRLQSVMISPTRKAAIINGVVVRLGEKYGDAVLVKVTENEVVLKSDGAKQVLKLHPGVEKREVRPVAAQSAERGRAAPPAATGRP